MRSLGAVLIAALALLTAAGCGGGNGKATTTTAKGATTTTDAAAGNGKCVGTNGKPLGSIDASDLASVVKEFDDREQVPVPIRDAWKTIGDGYRQLMAKVGDINLSPPPTDANTVAAIKDMTTDPTFAAALQKIETYCGLSTGG
jgi:hypothetical protein